MTRPTLIAALGLAVCCTPGCSKSDDDNKDKAPAKAAPAKPAPSKGKTPGDAAGLTGDIAPPPMPTPKKGAPERLPPMPAMGARVTECAITGASYAGKCTRLRNLRLARHGKYAYIAFKGDGVRRFRVGEGDGCALTLDKTFGKGGVLAFPKAKPKPQRLDKKGGVFLSSGDASYKLVVSAKGDVVVYDYIRGLHRIAGPSRPVSCPDVQGVTDALFAHGHLYAATMSKLYRVRLTKKGCKREEVALPGKGMSINRIGAWGKRLLVGGSAKGRRGKVISVIEGGKLTTQVGNTDSFARDGMCWVNGVAPCADGFCAVDGNCRTFKRFKADGTLHASMHLNEVLKRGLYGVYDLVGDADGALWMALSHRDPKQDTCTLRAYRARF